jgi:hypothetical protein
MPFDFKTPEVVSACDHFRIIDLPDSSLPFGYINLGPNREPKAATDRSDPKTRFISTCHNIAYRMQVKINGPRAGDHVFPNEDFLP